ncbi:hypothetical protein BDF14DRAFT_1800099 [Spinellus fusiger]|nr:hypothetical protein BDF14DRAFT_1800099 [Spinellus fusiger]
MKDKTLRLWNRDLAATLNFRHSLMSPRENSTFSYKRKHDSKDTTRTNKRSKLSYLSFSSPVIAGASVD